MFKPLLNLAILAALTAGTASPLASATKTAAEAASKPKPATNALCPVAGDKVSAKSKTVVVRGQEYRICCAGCDKKLLANPDKYLNKDGTPKNAKK